MNRHFDGVNDISTARSAIRLAGNVASVGSTGRASLRREKAGGSPIGSPNTRRHVGSPAASSKNGLGSSGPQSAPKVESVTQDPGTGLQVFDRQLDGGMFAVEPVDVHDVAVEVFEKRTVAPVGPEFLLHGAGEAGAANDHPPRHSSGALAGPMSAFGDFGLAVFGVLDRLPSVLRNARDCVVDRALTLVLMAFVQRTSRRVRLSIVALLQNPASNRIVNFRIGSSRRERPTSSFTKRVVSRWVSAEPFRKRWCKISPVLAIVASSGW